MLLAIIFNPSVGDNWRIRHSIALSFLHSSSKNSSAAQWGPINVSRRIYLILSIESLFYSCISIHRTPGWNWNHAKPVFTFSIMSPLSPEIYISFLQTMTVSSCPIWFCNTLINSRRPSVNKRSAAGSSCLKPSDETTWFPSPVISRVGLPYAHIAALISEGTYWESDFAI